MSLEMVIGKIQRMYAAVGAATESDLSSFPPMIQLTKNSITMRQDFNQNQSRPELDNKAFLVIRSIADMKDHLRAAARRIQREPDEVEEAINASLPLQLHD